MIPNIWGQSRNYGHADLQSERVHPDMLHRLSSSAVRRVLPVGAGSDHRLALKNRVESPYMGDFGTLDRVLGT